MRPAHPPVAATPTRLARALVADSAAVIDPKRVSMRVTNFGSFGLDWRTFGAGLEFPKGSWKTALFAGGLWLGGYVVGGLRVALCDYGTEDAPGPILAGGIPDDPSRPEHHVYTLQRRYADPATRDSALAAYLAGAVPNGAPPVAVLGDGSLTVRGDQVLWSVFNEADPASHTHLAGGTASLGLEVRQEVFAFDLPGALGQAVLLDYQILHEGTQPIDSLMAAVWLDPDLGGFIDDLAGSDPCRSLVFCYNASDQDALYGATPPALGLRLLRGLFDPAQGAALGVASLNAYIGGTDPDLPARAYGLMRGLDSQGQQRLDPTTGIVTPHAFTGDPLTGTGWLDRAPTDKRMLLSTGPVRMAPGDTQTVVAANVLADGPDRLASVAALRYLAASVARSGSGGLTAFQPEVEIALPGVIRIPLNGALLDYPVVNRVREQVFLDYELRGERAWPELAVSGVVVAGPESTVVIRVGALLPDTASLVRNPLTLTVTSRVAPVASRSVASGGFQRLELPETERLPAGIYVLRLVQGSRSVRTTVSLLR